MDLLDGLNDKQKEAVLHTEGPLLILAGAGSGKTRVLTHRAAYLIQQNKCKPYNILAITFTNKAAGEMKERIEKTVGFNPEGEVWVATFHSTCAKILRRFIDRIGYKNDFTIYDSDDQKTLIKNICKKLDIDTKIHKEKALAAQISHLKDKLITPTRFMLENEGDFTKKVLGQVYLEYQSQLKKNNALDFDDLIAKTVELFKTDEKVLDFYQSQFKYIMVDEYQDTNKAQFELIRLLANKSKNLCVVGDDDQSIYKFRGADITNILSFEQVFKNTTVIKLEQNYRSTQNILNCANGVIKNNEGRKEKTLWTENDAGDKIKFIRTQSAYDEAENVCAEINDYVRNGGEYKDCACLYRTNAQSRVLEERLIRFRIPYKIVGGVNFYQRKEVKDMLAYLKTIESGLDDIAVRRIINVPKRAIGATSIAKVQKYADDNDINFYDALIQVEEQQALGKTSAKISAFLDLIRSFRDKLGNISLTELLEAVMVETGYIKELEAEKTDEAKDRIENIYELVSKMAQYEKDHTDATLTGFLEEVALIADIDSLDESNDYVVLLTIHSAKGLEFDNVFLCGMEDGLFPGTGSITEPDELEEERRLCYVAMTRAKRHLTLTCARERMIHGEWVRNNISRFVGEIPKEVMNENEAKEIETEEKKSTIMKPSQSSNAKAVFTTKAFGMESHEKADKLSYDVGDTVKHIKFGVGKVLEIVDGGKDFEVTVEFEKAGVKKMFAGFAKLKKI
ncbi:MAG: DNA helicase PcrA [Lachnospiraceae bacterium]|nr:DNA helicase PcrA [Lachnospiraceae bacterium]